MNQEKLDKILGCHKACLKGSGKGYRADLSNAKVELGDMVNYKRAELMINDVCRRYNGNLSLKKS